MLFEQAEYSIRCEWGEYGISMLSPISDIVIIVDVLSFSTALEIATNQGAKVFPFRWKDERVFDFAESVSAEVAGKSNRNGYSLSPRSLLMLPPAARLVLPSPNGSTLSLLSKSDVTIAGCLRNCEAVAELAALKGKSIAVIPAGERWEDGSLRPCIEDILGAGAILSYLTGSFSPEASAVREVFKSMSHDIFGFLKGCGSGREKIQRGEEQDVLLASDLNVSDCVPVLVENFFVREN